MKLDSAHSSAMRPPREYARREKGYRLSGTESIAQCRLWVLAV